MSAVSLDRHIEVSNGKAKIAGHRISIQDIVTWHERQGKSVDEIATEYDLTLAEVYAGLAYYFDNRLEIEQQMQESKDFVSNLQTSIKSKLR